MPLQKQVLSIPFRKSLDTKTDPLQIQLGSFLALNNTVFTNDGLLQKRNGFDVLGSALTSGNALFNYQNELIALDGETLNSYSAIQNTTDSKGVKVSCDISATPIVRNFNTQTYADSAVHPAGFTVYAYNETGNGVKYIIQDTVTGQMIGSGTLSFTAANPKVKVLGSYVIILYVDSISSSPALKYVYISSSAPTVVSSPTTISSLTLGSTIYDAQTATLSATTNLYIAFQTSSTVFAVDYLDTSLALHTGPTPTQSVTSLCVFGDASGDIWWAGSYTSSGNTIIFAQAYNFNLTSQILAPTTVETLSNNPEIENITGITPITTANLWYEIANSDGNVYDEYVRTNTITIGGVVGTAADFWRSVGLASKPFIFNGNIYLTITHASTLQATYFISDSNKNIVSKFAYSNGGGLYDIELLPEVSSLTASSFSIPYLFKDNLETQNGIVSSQTGINSLTITFGNESQFVYTANDLHISGGIISLYDKNSVSELGFNLNPENVIVNQGFAGGALSAGQYQYAAVYEWGDNQGNIHRSAPSVPNTIQNGTSLPFTFAATFTSGNSFLTVPGNPPQFPFPSAYSLTPGMALVGTGLATNTYIKFLAPEAAFPPYYDIFFNPAATATETNELITAKAEFNFTANVQAGNQTFSINYDSNLADLPQSGPLPAMYFNADYNVKNITVGSVFTLTAYKTQGLRVGMLVAEFSTKGFDTTTGVLSSPYLNGFGYITAISGNTLTIYGQTHSTFTGSKSAAVLGGATVGNFHATAGSTTLTFSSGGNFGDAGITPAQAYKPGDYVLINGNDSSTGFYTVQSSNATSITLTTAVDTGGSGPVFFDVYLMINAVNYLNIGQTIQSVDGTTIPTGSVIKAINYSANVNSVTVDQNPTATNTTTPSVTTQININEIIVPTLRVTNKSTPISITLYRTASNGTTFYRVSSLTNLTYNSLSSDSVTFYDYLPDNQIIGNEILYTTGGVVENIGPPATSIMTTYKSRLMLVDAEDQNLLWYSKQIIEDTPVEMSDLFTIFVTPSTGVASNTGPVKALSTMDDKLIIFKDSSAFYMIGNGPDNTGANNDFSDPIFISSAAGCSNPNSIVLIPNGLMFQASHNKGIWLLSRDLSMNYVGSPVEFANGTTVTSAQLIPGTTQVRFTLNNGTFLMYDYYYGKWGTFSTLSAVSSTIFESLHTYLDSSGVIHQENPGVYLDNTTPVLMNFTTGWLNVAGIEGFERFYYMLMLGKFISNCNWQFTINYNYETTAVQGEPAPQTVTVIPDGDPIFEARVFPNAQKFTAFQIQGQEVFTGTNGAGLKLSGIDMVMGLKKPYRTSRASRNFG